MPQVIATDNDGANIVDWQWDLREIVIQSISGFRCARTNLNFYVFLCKTSPKGRLIISKVIDMLHDNRHFQSQIEEWINNKTWRYQILLFLLFLFRCIL